MTDDIMSWTIRDLCNHAPEEITCSISSNAGTPPGVWAGVGTLIGGRLKLYLSRDPGTEGYKRGWRYSLVEYDVVRLRDEREIGEGYVKSEKELLSLFRALVDSEREYVDQYR